jgi:putative FmdB family regulatory protein
MPIYEYRCQACKRRTSLFVRSVNTEVRAKCEHCGSAKMSRAVSRFAVHRGAMNFDDPSSLEGFDESDPRAMARFARQMADETGEDMGPEFEEMVGRMESGESPDDFMDGEGSGDDGGEDDF